jgi:alkylation response protein AidB-like acyl-CoA dehydrogenase
MPENFFTDNPDLEFHLDNLDLSEVVEVLEKGYSHHKENPAAPRKAKEADEEGVRLVDGEVIYAAATQDAMALLRQAGLLYAPLPWERGGLNLPESILQMCVEIVSRADSAVMSVYGLQELAAIAISEHGDEEMKARK